MGKTQDKKDISQVCLGLFHVPSEHLGQVHVILKSLGMSLK
jgi:hypothetical protein